MGDDPASEDSAFETEPEGPRQSLSELDLGAELDFDATDEDRETVVGAGLVVSGPFKAFLGEVALTDASDELSDELLGELDLDVGLITLSFELDSSSTDIFSPLDSSSPSDFSLSLASSLSESELVDDDVSDVSSSSSSDNWVSDLDCEVAEVSLSRTDGDSGSLTTGAFFPLLRLG